MLQESYPGLAERVFLLKEMTGEQGDVHDPIGTDIVNYRAMASEVKDILERGFDRIGELALETDTDK